MRYDNPTIIAVSSATDSIKQHTHTNSNKHSSVCHDGSGNATSNGAYELDE